MKQFRNKVTGKSVHVYERDGQWFLKFTVKGQRIGQAKPHGPFKNEGQALLHCCMDQSLKFNDYSQVYPRMGRQSG